MGEQAHDVRGAWMMDTSPDASQAYLRSTAHSIRIRYLDSGEGAAYDEGGGGKAPLTPDGQRPHLGRTSIIVIRRPYAFLVPAIRSLFEGDEDVQVLVDRRQCERHALATLVVGDAQFRTRERRGSLPILDVVIDLGA
jgi:hypothetical protein